MSDHEPDENEVDNVLSEEKQLETKMKWKVLAEVKVGSDADDDLLRAQQQTTGEDLDNHLDREVSEKQFFVGRTW